jgi:hypothetical protein
MLDCIALLVVAAATAAAPAAPGTAQDPEPIERLEAWPDIEDESAAKREMSRLRVAQTEAMGEEGGAALRAMGAAVAPMLLKAYEKERDDDARDRVHAVLLAVTGAPHTRLLAREFKHKSPLVRTFCLRRVAAFPDPGVREPAEAALDGLEKRGDKADPEELYLAAVCATSAGSEAGLERVFARARDHWKEDGASIRVALEAVRGEQVSDIFAKRLAENKGLERADRLALLHVLAGCGTETAKGAVRRYLDDDDNGLRIAAINALRGMVDREPPIDQLPVFEAIEVANAWKRRL